MKKLNLRLLRHMRQAKGQFIALALVIVLGLMMFVAMNSAYVNLKASLDEHYEVHRLADVFAEVMKISSSDVEGLKTHVQVQAVEGRFVYDVPLNVQSEEKVRVRLISSLYSKDSLNKLHALKGLNYVTSSDECLVIEKFADARHIQLGDVITPHIGGRDYHLKVVGIVSSPEYVYLMENEKSLLPAPTKFGVVYTTEAFIKQSIGVGDHYNQLLFDLKDPSYADAYIKLLEHQLEAFGVGRIYSRKDQLSNRMVHEEMKGLEQSASTVPMLFLGVAAFIMGVMINRLVKNDRLAIGILKSMGYSDRDILLHYTKLSVIVGFVGGVGGVGLGYGLSLQFTNIYNDFFSIPELTLVFKPELILMSAVLVALFSVLAGLLGARKSLAISPAESMRPEPPKTGRRIFLETTRFWRSLSFSNKMVLRNVLRSRKRVVFIALGIALTFVVTLVPFYMLSAFSGMFDKMYDEFQTMDYVINFSYGLEESVVNDFKNTLKISEVEGKLEFPFELRHEWRTKVTPIIGLEKDSIFFNFVDEKDKPIFLKKGDFFLSEGLARSLDIEVGEEIAIESFIPHREDVVVRLTGIIKQNLGANGYMLLEDMQKLLLDQGYVNGLYVGTETSLKESLETYKNIASIQSSQDLKNTFEEFLGLVYASLTFLIVFGGILGFAIVYNSAVIAINERQLELSSLRVMGFTKNEIFVGLIKENMIYGFVGIIVGIPLGSWLLRVISRTFSTDIYAFDVTLEWHHYLLTGTTVFGFIVVALLATYKKIHGLNFIEALKNRMT